MRESTSTIVFISVSKLVSVTRGSTPTRTRLFCEIFVTQAGRPDVTWRVLPRIRTGHCAQRVPAPARSVAAIAPCEGGGDAQLCRDQSAAKGERHARENGWLALSALALQYQCHISRVLRLRADADARREFQLMTRMRSTAARLPTAEQGKTCSARPNRGDSQSTRVTPEMSRKISTTRRNLVSSIRSKRRSPSHVPATTAGKHQK